MRRDEYPDPHHVTIVARDLGEIGLSSMTSFESVETVLIDGRPVCLVKDAVLRIEPSVGGAGHSVTMEVLAGRLSMEHYEEPPYEPKHLVGRG
jgi:hypothetical protein